MSSLLPNFSPNSLNLFIQKVSDTSLFAKDIPNLPKMDHPWQAANKVAGHELVCVLQFDTVKLILNLFPFPLEVEKNWVLFQFNACITFSLGVSKSILLNVSIEEVLLSGKNSHI